MFTQQLYIQFLLKPIYSLLRPYRCRLACQILPVHGRLNLEIHEGLEFFSDTSDYEDYSFGIFSVKFSKDGRELIAASSNEPIYIDDLQGHRLSQRFAAIL